MVSSTAVGTQKDNTVHSTWFLELGRFNVVDALSVCLSAQTLARLLSFTARDTLFCPLA